MSHEVVKTLALMTPTLDFRDTIDTTRYTKVVIIGLSSLPAATVHNETTDADVDIPIGAEWWWVGTKTAIAEAGYTVIYGY